MSPHRCQVCGRRKGLTKAGVIVMHYLRGERCLGAHAAPYARENSALASALAHWSDRARRLQAMWQDHRDRRLNEPLSPWFWSAWSAATREELRLSSRLRRWTPDASA